MVSAKMDVSTVQSKSSSSDFSIERLLSDEPKRDNTTAPSWLCCTRYQPPRISRPSNTGNTTRARRSGRHARVPFTAAQAQALEAAYSRAPYLAPPALRALAAALQLRDDRIKIWFQNRRARERREKSSTIVPPHSVPLPPTTISRSLIPLTWITAIPGSGQSAGFSNTVSSESPVERYSQDYSVSEESDHDSIDVETLEGTD